jgi:hypothetical protein
MTRVQVAKRAAKAAHRQRLAAFHGCDTAARVAEFTRRERQMRERVQRIIDAKVAPKLFGNYVNLAGQPRHA